MVLAFIEVNETGSPLRTEAPGDRTVTRRFLLSRVHEPPLLSVKKTTEDGSVLVGSCWGSLMTVG